MKGIKHITIFAFLLFFINILSVNKTYSWSLINNNFTSFTTIASNGIESHHIFPQQFALYFENHGIDINCYCIPLAQNEHIKLHHDIRYVPYCFNYNDSWEAFIKTNPKTTQYHIFGFATNLLCQFGIKSIRVHNYRDTKPNGKTFPPELIKEDLVTRLKNIGNSPRIAAASSVLKKMAVPIATVYLAYQVYEIFENLDDNFSNDEYVRKSYDILLESIIINDEGDEDKAVHKIGEAYFFLGYAYFHKYVEYKTQFTKEITDYFSSQSDRYRKQAQDFFKKSLQLNEDIPYSHFYYAKLMSLNDSKYEARKYFEKSIELFRKEDNKEFIELANQELAQLN
ncbi:MAG TPA: DUF2380 domain-containing protein [bacterium]|nr:DUF2380 domain-containing protein [bacterium]